jgi:tRNA(Ile)-lysidine synthase
MRTLDDLADVAARALARHESNLGRRPLLVAVSGGADSTALAHAVGRLKRTKRLSGEPILVHCDHGQGDRTFRASAAALTAELAWHYRVRFRLVRLDLERGASEARMREARYDAFLDLARELGASAVLTAHHADDDLETVLFRMLRGTGPRGLAGIPRSRWLAPGVLAIRPFLDVRRSDLRAALSAHGANWVEDASNADPHANSRSAIRNMLLPELRAQHGVRFEADLFAVARVARATTAVLEAEATRLLTERTRTRARGAIVEFDLREFHRGAEPGGLDVIREALRQLHARLVAASPSTIWLDRATALLRSRPGTRLDGGGGVLAERLKRGLVLWAPDRLAPEPEPIEVGVDDRVVRFGESGWKFAAKVPTGVPLAPHRDVDDYRAVLDAAGVALPLRVRAPRHDDLFRPLGSSEPLRLGKFLQKRGVPRVERSRHPVVVDGKDERRILWVPGLEIADDARIRTAVDPVRDPGRRRPTRACLELRALVG